MSEIAINYKGSTIASMDSSGTKTLLTSGKYCEGNIAVVYSRPSAPSPTLQTKSVAFTPAETLQTSSVTADAGYDGLSAVDITINAIPSAYIIPSGTSSITSNGIYDITSFASVDVNVAGGGGDHSAEDGIINGTLSEYTNSRVTSLRSYAFYMHKSIQTADFPNVTTIGSSAFYACTILESANIPKVTELPMWAFGYCSSLITASFPSVTTVGYSAFASCIKLTTASFPSVTTISSSAFNGCTQLANIYFPNLESLGQFAFVNCPSLTAIDFSKCTFVPVSAFAYCYRISTASFPKATTVANHAFYNCSRLESLYLLGSTVATLGGLYAFSNTPMSKSSYLGRWGSVFVPASLVDTYKSASRWSTFAARITSYVEP